MASRISGPCSKGERLYAKESWSLTQNVTKKEFFPYPICSTNIAHILVSLNNHFYWAAYELMKYVRSKIEDEKRTIEQELDLFCKHFRNLWDWCSKGVIICHLSFCYLAKSCFRPMLRLRYAYTSPMLRLRYDIAWIIVKFPAWGKLFPCLGKTFSLTREKYFP